MPPVRISNRRDVLLLMLYSPGRTGEINEAINGRTRLVKLLFVFKKEALSAFKSGTSITEENFYKFFPWDFGPFSVEVYDDIAFFQLRGFVETSRASEESLPESVAEWNEWLDRTDVDDSVESYEEEAFRLTEAGVKFTAALYEQLSQAQKGLLKAFKGKFSSAPLRSILRYVYETYPDFTTQSTIKADILGNDTL